LSISNGYVTLEEYKLFADIDSTDTDDDAAIESIIEGVSRYIDLKTQRTFYARTETRKYSLPSDGGRELELDDDLLTITELLNGDDVEIEATDYNLLPINETPKSAIRLKQTSTIFWALDSDGNSEFVIDVAGTWGYMDPHTDDIREACLMTTQSFVKRRFGKNMSGIAKVTAMGVVITPQDVPSSAADIINIYKKWI
jgi:hypothetical protein